MKAVRTGRWLTLMLWALGAVGASTAQERLLPLSAVRSGLEFAGAEDRKSVV